VADVVVDYKDLVRMANEKAMSRASLARVSMRGTNPLQAIARPELDRLDWPQLAAVRQAIAQRDEAALDQLVQALQQRADQQPLAEFAAALRTALRQASAVEPLLAALDVYVARGRGCHVAVRAP
jgi:cellulase/cellobiase CelA1